MKFALQHLSIGLSTREPLDLEDVEGSTIRVLRGRVWLTQEGSPDDVFLDAGAGHTFRANGRAIVSVEGTRDACATIVFDGRLSVASRPTIASVLRRLLGSRPAGASTWKALEA